MPRVIARLDPGEGGLELGCDIVLVVPSREPERVEDDAFELGRGLSVPLAGLESEPEVVERPLPSADRHRSPGAVDVDFYRGDRAGISPDG